jgi:hypothetical protein
MRVQKTSLFALLSEHVLVLAVAFRTLAQARFRESVKKCARRGKESEGLREGRLGEDQIDRGWAECMHAVDVDHPTCPPATHPLSTNKGAAKRHAALLTNSRVTGHLNPL